MINDLHEALKRDFKRIQPMLPELFNISYAVCGSFDAAEYAMRSALLAVLQRTGRLRPSERLRRQVLRYARRQNTSSEEKTWDGLKNIEGCALSQEELPKRRLAVLVYGCELSEAQAARITGMSTREAVDILDMLERQMRGNVKAGMEKYVRHWMKSPNADMPEAANVLRALEAELADGKRMGRRFSGILNVILIILMIALLGGLFWLVAVLNAPVRSMV